MTSAMLRSRSGISTVDLHEFSDRNEALLADLSGAAIFITGATGWFGVWLLETLCSANDLLGLGMSITALSRNPRAFLTKFPAFKSCDSLSWLQGDVRQLEQIEGSFTHLIHGATDTSAQPDHSAAIRLIETMVGGARLTMSLAARCDKAILLSSGAVYGPSRPDESGFAESDVARGPDPMSPQSSYAEGKRAAEVIAALAAAAGAHISVARCFAFVGPHIPLEGHFAIGNFIADAVGGRPITIKSDGKPLRSYLYMSDLVTALLTILVRGAKGAAYNVGSDEVFSIAEVASHVARVVGGKQIDVLGVPSAPGTDYVPNIDRLRSELGFKPEIKLDEALARTATWCRSKTDRSLA